MQADPQSRRSPNATVKKAKALCKLKAPKDLTTSFTCFCNTLPSVTCELKVPVFQRALSRELICFHVLNTKAPQRIMARKITTGGPYLLRLKVITEVSETKLGLELGQHHHDNS